jgi:hypothetical protein
MFLTFIQARDRDFLAPKTADVPIDAVATPPAVEPLSDLGRIGLAGCEPGDSEAELRRLGLVGGPGAAESARWM